jgi:hypothetical protein
MFLRLKARSFASWRNSTEYQFSASSSLRVYLKLTSTCRAHHLYHYVDRKKT